MTPSQSGRWAIRSQDDFARNAAGYGSGGWSYALVEVATGQVRRTWTGSGTQSPWSESSLGTTSVAWDGDTLVVTDADGTTQRVDPESLAPRP